MITHEANENKIESGIDILHSIESMLQKGNENIKHFTSKLVNTLTLNYSSQSLIQFLIKSLQNKKIYFIRHTEAFHNKYKGKISSHSFSDPGLTSIGLQQAESLSKIIKEKGFEIDLVCISPLKRTIQTFNLIYNSFGNKALFIITDLLRGPSKSSSKNVGMPLDEIKEYFLKEKIRINLSYITKKNWWNDVDNAAFESESKQIFHLRIQLFLLWAAFRKERNICIVSHSTVFKYIMKSKCSNGQMINIPIETIEEKCNELFKDNCIFIN